jgi:hypothetical protein
LRNRNIGSKFSIFLISIIIVETEILIEIEILAIVRKISRKLDFIPVLTFSVICCCLADILSIIRIILSKIAAIRSAFKAFLSEVIGIVSILNIILLKIIGII